MESTTTESTTTESTTTESTTTGGIRKVGDGETKNRNSSALAQFAKYLEMRFDGKKRYKELIDSDINVELFQCFGGFLIDHAVHGTTKKPLTLGTAWQYLSDTKTALTKRFKRNELLSSSNELWYKDVRAAVSKHIIKRCIAQGVRISEKTSPVGKELMKRIGEYIIHRASDFSDNVNKQKKLNRVLTKGLGLLYDDEKRFLDEPKPCMASQSTSYREWKSNLKCIAEKVELRVIVDLFGQENYDKFHPKKKASKKYINSIYDAMSARRDSDGNIIPRTKKRKLQSDVSNL